MYIECALEPCESRAALSRANLGGLRERSVIREFVIADQVPHIVERLLADDPRVVTFGVYIWNIRESERVAAMLRALRPDVKIICGGPELSFGTDHSAFDTIADCIITGEGDITYRKICEKLLAGDQVPKRIQGEKPDLKTLKLPYDEYSDEDVLRRIIYVEASRGCPFTCEFCLSSIDEKVRSFDLGEFLSAMDRLIQRGCRTFKFVDRTFNLKPSSCARILNFFYDSWPRNEDGSLIAPLSTRQMDGGEARNEAFFLHFEMVPDRLPETIKELIERFPAGSIQFEVGIQSFTPEVGELISRRMDLDKTAENLTYLREGHLVHVHADLIVGLSGETPESFITSYDALYRLGPDEIQVGILKLLKGTPLIRHQERFGMVFNPEPPYDLLASKLFPFDEMQRFKRFARYHELFVNSGRFGPAIELLTSSDTSPCRTLLGFSDWLWESTHQEHQFALRRQYDLLIDYLLEIGIDEDRVLNALTECVLMSGNKRGMPDRLRTRVESRMYAKPLA